MTTFTSDDREEEYKKILKETQALEKGLKFFKKLKGDNASPPHIVDSGASVMTKELTDDEIQDACAAAYTAKQKVKQAVLDKLGITADEAALLLG